MREIEDGCLPSISIGLLGLGLFFILTSEPIHSEGINWKGLLFMLFFPIQFLFYLLLNIRKKRKFKIEQTNKKNIEEEISSLWSNYFDTIGILIPLVLIIYIFYIYFTA